MSKQINQLSEAQALHALAMKLDPSVKAGRCRLGNIRYQLSKLCHNCENWQDKVEIQALYNDVKLIKE